MMLKEQAEYEEQYRKRLEAFIVDIPLIGTGRVDNSTLFWLIAGIGGFIVYKAVKYFSKPVTNVVDASTAATGAANQIAQSAEKRVNKMTNAESGQAKQKEGEKQLSLSKLLNPSSTIPTKSQAISGTGYEIIIKGA